MQQAQPQPRPMSPSRHTLLLLMPSACLLGQAAMCSRHYGPMCGAALVGSWLLGAAGLSQSVVWSPVHSHSVQEAPCPPLPPPLGGCCSASAARQLRTALLRLQPQRCCLCSPSYGTTACVNALPSAADHQQSAGALEIALKQRLESVCRAGCLVVPQAHDKVHPIARNVLVLATNKAGSEGARPVPSVIPWTWATTPLPAIPAAINACVWGVYATYYRLWAQYSGGYTSALQVSGTIWLQA